MRGRLVYRHLLSGLEVEITSEVRKLQKFSIPQSMNRNQELRVSLLIDDGRHADCTAVWLKNDARLACGLVCG